MERVKSSRRINMYCPNCEDIQQCWQVGGLERSFISVPGFRDVHYVKREQECQTCMKYFYTAEIESVWLTHIKERMHEAPYPSEPASELVRSWILEVELLAGRMQAATNGAEALAAKIETSIIQHDFSKSKK